MAQCGGDFDVACVAPLTRLPRVKTRATIGALPRHSLVVLRAAMPRVQTAESVPGADEVVGMVGMEDCPRPIVFAVTNFDPDQTGAACPPHRLTT